MDVDFLIYLWNGRYYKELVSKDMKQQGVKEPAQASKDPMIQLVIYCSKLVLYDIRVPYNT